MNNEKIIYTKCCSRCNEIKPITTFVFNKNFCKECKNLRCRELRFEKNQVLLKEIEKVIGEGNKKCNYCDKIFSKIYLRGHKCLDCKRKCDNDYNKKFIIKEQKNFKRKNNPIFKIKHSINTRIRMAFKNKCKRSIEYLECSFEEFNNWMLFNFIDDFTFENYGSIWHIDHVIPLSHFDLENIDEQLIAFNWRNTMPLNAKENLSKNCKILKPQIEQHLEKLKKYHIENKLDLPQVFINLFAKHLVAGSPLEPMLSNK